MNYNEFIQSKKRRINSKGINVQDLNPMLKDFQRFSVDISLKNGKFCLFEDCGLGKTFQQLEFAKHTSLHTGRPSLILAPLAVTGQTVAEGLKFGIEVNEYNDSFKPGINISNYENLHNIDIAEPATIVLDESSILKNFEGARRNAIVDSFKNTPFKLACSATPSPNDPMELGNHSEFLGIMSRQEMLATYFVHDGGDTSKWRLKHHAVNDFWRWVNSWSLMFSKPSDIGFSDDGYILPELKFIERQIITELKEGKIVNDTAVSATDFHKEVRLTRLSRIQEIASIVNNSDESFIVWVEHDEEGDILEKMISGSIQVKGSQKSEYKISKLTGFANNEFRVLITKGKIAGLGMNYQNCHNQIFASPDFSFEKIYQAIRRSFRYGQLHHVNIYLIVTDTMQSVIKSFERKQAQHKMMQKQLSKHTIELYNEEYLLYSKAA